MEKKMPPISVTSQYAAKINKTKYKNTRGKKYILPVANQSLKKKNH